MESQKRKRCRFQFSLRTLMIVVTLLAVPLGYVGWQAKIVRERKAYLQAIDKLHSGHWYVIETGTIRMFAEGDKAQAPTGIRIGLGDQAQVSVSVDPEASLEAKQSVAALFPEAIIWERP